MMVVSARTLRFRAGKDNRCRSLRPIASTLAAGLLVVGIGVTPASAAAGVMTAHTGTATAAATYAPVPPAVPVPSAPSLAVVAPVTTGLDSFGSAVLDAINAQRAAAGVPGLAEARGIDALSLSWSARMAAAGSLSHNPQGWEDVLDSGAAGRSAYGENVSSWTGSPVTGSTLTTALVGNASNKRNILDPAYRYVGIGTAPGPAGTQWNTITFVDAVDTGQAYDPALRTIPVGQLNSATLEGSTVQVTGWGYDPDTATTPIQVRLTDTAPDGSVVTATATADVVRPDVPRFTSATGTAHGFAATLPISRRGTHQICATLLNAGAGTVDPDLGCLPVTVTGPIGRLDAAALTGSAISFAGWAVDPDSPTTPTTVTVTDQGPDGIRTLPTVTAGQTDVNVAASIPGVGAAHGFLALTGNAAVGTHLLCATANSLAAPVLTRSLGCQSVTVAAPTGAITGTTNTTTAITVDGWALDPNAAAGASTVRLRVSGPTGPIGTPSLVTADAPGTASTRQFPTAGQAHAFRVTIPIRQYGAYQVCAAAQSLTDPDSTVEIGCRKVTVSNLSGWFDSATVVDSSIQVRGWAIDESHRTSTDPMTIKVTGPSGSRTTQVPANAYRPDVGRIAPAAGNYHGLLTWVPNAGKGVNTVCVGAVATADQTTRQFRCRTVNVP